MAARSEWARFRGWVSVVVIMPGSTCARRLLNLMPVEMKGKKKRKERGGGVYAGR